MIPIDIQVSRSKFKVKGQAYSSYVGEGGHLCFTNSYISINGSCNIAVAKNEILFVKITHFL